MDRAARGAAIVAVAWGVFGLLTGGLSRLVIYAVLGAVCGGIFVYYVSLNLSDAELKNIAKQMPANSSVFLAFLKTSHVPQIMESVSKYTPSTSNLVKVGEDLSASVISGMSGKAAQLSLTSTPGQAGADDDNPLSILIFRYTGHQNARQVEAKLREEWNNAGNAILGQVMIAVDEEKKVHRYNPSKGVRAQAISNMSSGAFSGLILGALTSLYSGGSLPSALSSGVTRLVAYALYGLVAGALVAFVVNRSLPTSRVKKLSTFFLPTRADTSVVLALVQGNYTQQMTRNLSAHDAKGLIIRVNTASSSEGGLELCRVG